VLIAEYFHIEVRMTKIAELGHISSLPSFPASQRTMPAKSNAWPSLDSLQLQIPIATMAEAAEEDRENPMPKIEIPIFGAHSAASLYEAGIPRFELSAAGSYAAGGLTPSLAELRSVVDLRAKRKGKPFAVRVMIRPRGPPPHAQVDGTTRQDFLYDEAEFEMMKRSLVEIKDSGLLQAELGDGFVFGILKPVDEGEGKGTAAATPRLILDEHRNAGLVHLAAPYACVFHRAFDDALAAYVDSEHDQVLERLLDSIVSCGCKGILTSGGPGNAPDNAGVLAELVELAAGRIQIIVGGGVRGHNVKKLAKALDVWSGEPSERDVWFHSSCLAPTKQNPDEELADPKEVAAMLEELRRAR
jgi:copper homeostasis protein